MPRTQTQQLAPTIYVPSGTPKETVDLMLARQSRQLEQPQLRAAA